MNVRGSGRGLQFDVLGRGGGFLRRRRGLGGGAGLDEVEEAAAHILGVELQRLMPSSTEAAAPPLTAAASKALALMARTAGSASAACTAPCRW